MRLDSGLTVLAVVFICAASHCDVAQAKHKLEDHIPTFELEGWKDEMDVGSEERTSGCGYYNLTTPASSLERETESLPVRSTTDSPKINVHTTRPPKRPTCGFMILYGPNGGKGSRQNCDTPLNKAHRRYLNSLKNALANGEIRPSVMNGRSLQFIKSVNNVNNVNTQMNPASAILMPKNGGSDLSWLVQTLRKYIAQQTRNQGPSQNQLPQRGSNQNNFPQGGSPQDGSNQNNFPQGGSPQGGSNQNNFPQGGLPQRGPSQNNFSQGRLPQGGSNQNNFSQGGSNQNIFPQGGSPQGGSNQNNFPQGKAPPSLYQLMRKIGQKQ